MSFASLEAEQSALLVLTRMIPLDELIALSRVSKSAHTVAKLGLQCIKLQSGEKQPSAKMLQGLVASPLTDFGASLVELDASFCRSITNETLRSLPKLPNLRTLILDGCQDVDDDGLIAVAQRCQHLRHISLYWNVKATDTGIGKIIRAQKGQNFHFVSFSGCKNFGDETVQRLVGKRPNIEVLDLTRCPRVTDSGALLACECLDRLRVLRLYAMAQLSPQAFRALKRLVWLEELDLCGCRVQDGPVVEFLEAAAPSRLHTLNLTWCPDLTDVVVQTIAKTCPVLSWLSLFGNMNYTAAALETLAASQCGSSLRALDVRGLTKALPYSLETEALRKLFPSVTCIELHH